MGVQSVAPEAGTAVATGAGRPVLIYVDKLASPITGASQTVSQASRQSERILGYWSADRLSGRSADPWSHWDGAGVQTVRWQFATG